MEELKQKFFQKKTSLICLVLMCVSLLSIILVLFVPLISIPDSADAGASDNGTYCGWQIAFYYFGKRFQVGTYYFGFNIWLALGIILPVLAVIVSLVMWKKAKTVKRAVLLFVLAVVLVYSGTVFLNALDISYMSAAPDMKLIMFYAKDSKTGYDLLAYPVIYFVICLLSAAAFTATGIFQLAIRKVS